MLRRRLIALSVSPLLAAGLLSGAEPAGAVSTPSSISTVAAVPGARPGEVQFRWSTAGDNTGYFLLETGLTAFSKSSSSSLPTSGRNAKTFVIDRRCADLHPDRRPGRQRRRVRWVRPTTSTTGSPR